jgi:hypothetical protein
MIKFKFDQILVLALIFVNFVGTNVILIKFGAITNYIRIKIGIVVV